MSDSKRQKGGVYKIPAPTFDALARRAANATNVANFLVLCSETLRVLSAIVPMSDQNVADLAAHSLNCHVTGDPRQRPPGGYERD